MSIDLEMLYICQLHFCPWNEQKNSDGLIVVAERFAFLLDGATTANHGPKWNRYFLMNEILLFNYTYRSFLLFTKIPSIWCHFLHINFIIKVYDVSNFYRKVNESIKNKFFCEKYRFLLFSSFSVFIRTSLYMLLVACGCFL